jgi:hypothetical protein
MDVRQIEKHAMDIWVSLEHCCEQAPRAASDIDDALHAVKRAAGQYLAGNEPADFCHRAIKDCRSLFVALKKFETTRSPIPLPRGFTCPDAVKEIARARP